MSETLGEFLEKKSEVKMLARKRLLTIVIVFVLASLSFTSAILYVRMVDYHDAKYRSQNVMLFVLSSYAAFASDRVTVVANTSAPMIERALASTDADNLLGYMSSLTWAVREMYLNDEYKNATFALLDKAIEAVRGNVLLLKTFIIWNVTNGWAMMESPNASAGLVASAPLLIELSNTIQAGFKSPDDFEQHPYSVVDRIDLAKLRDIADSIYDAFAG